MDATTERHARPTRGLPWLMMLFVGVVAVLLAVSTRPAGAQESEDRDPLWNSEGCLSCHEDSDEILTFPSGEELGIGVDGAGFRATPHAEVGVECLHCHSNIVKVPHDPVTV
ncbi:MAG: hypothetical protein R3324_19340, partial [Halobacteriales archaeon]|nr:hypothetical protein [Halobacteriales archaeon]